MFWVKGKQIFTPPLSEGCVAGVMRAFLLDELAKKGVSVVQKPLTVAALTEADELFVSNAIRRIKWVWSMGDKTFDHAESQRISSIIF